MSPTLSVDLPSACVRLWTSDPSQLARDSGREVAFFLYGYLYETGGDDQAAWCLQQYLQHGLDFVSSLNGAFVIIVVDAREDRALVITDHFNHHRAFHSETHGAHWISNCLHTHPLQNAELDLTALAWVLVNKSCYNFRTLFAGVRFLERASIYTFADGRLQHRRYWQFRFQPPSGKLDAKKLKGELAELLIDSVRRRLPRNGPPFLSLSGGYDASSILGIMKYQLHVPEAICFTYINRPKPAPGSDGEVAGKMAERAGYRHLLLQGYGGDLMPWLDDNGSIGNGVANVSGQFDAFVSLTPWFERYPHSAVFLGDHCFFLKPYNVRTRGDALHLVYLFELSSAPHLRHLFDDSTYSLMEEGLRADRQALLDRFPDVSDKYDLKDLLYQDERMSNYILSQKEYLIEEFAPVANPYLDRSILDFQSRLPNTKAFANELYRSTLLELAPEIFAIPRATVGEFNVDWGKEFRVHRDAIEELLFERNSILDELVPPEKIMALIDGSDDPPAIKSAGQRAADVSARLFRKLTGRLPYMPVIPTSRALTIRRLLCVRSFLNKTIDRQR
ncbi:MAG: asparagine synthase-related protein [Planctomycetaceae bacterium]